jgi:hypothetical protein
MAGLMNALPGKYRLEAGIFRQIDVDERSHKISSWTTFHKGDVVELNAEDADRLLRAGAVKPTTKSQRDTEAGLAGSVLKDAAVAAAVAAPGVGGIEVKAGETTVVAEAEVTPGVPAGG